ncbi:MAG: alpha/beta hydrolase, partial [Myxococcota bacterium]
WMASLYPERLHGINIFDGPGFWPPDFDPVLRSATRSRLVRWVGTLPLFRRPLMVQNFKVATNRGYKHFKPSDAAVEEYRRVCFDPQKHQNAFDYLGSYSADLTLLGERLPTLSVPTLITWGGEDPFVLPSNAARLHEVLPNSELTIFEEAGHFSHEDADARWLERLVRFAEEKLTESNAVAV